ncbi:glycosyltransferase family 2 protein [Herbaspirillum sp. LeCh32-8]|uniref:glycosyltransferase family 2 protein n=1 Tax=Herbaspirillum sp. LeCh32-8 TaxID=2821356 RepID=UPI001AEA26EB|nr:glycosyltransferase family 2 protein [Herbaspirillum sp. LeCh32-8]MBP0597858.1 glycosyltransferase family 2 protein [Herbaspirillum sp. LeCh32-8]
MNDALTIAPTTAAVIPVYNHEHAIGAVVDAVLAHGLHCVLVDDGCSAACAQVLREIAAAHPQQVTLLVHAVNQGKGGAVITGLRHAARAGYSHALQIDADGQHDAADIPRFLAASLAAPRAVINGKPVYDESIPKGRLYARYLTHVWVWINTLSLEISDSMCGFRVYPLAPVLKLLDSVRIGRRMDFDTEILVRLQWRGLRILDQPTRVHYPTDGVSHFKVWLDNVLISRMHARLFFGMLPRSPLLLARKLGRALAGPPR